MGGDVPFKIKIQPKLKDERHKKGAGSFKEANGAGCLELVCVSEELKHFESFPALKFTFCIGSSAKQRSETTRKAVVHNFLDRHIAVLPPNEALFRFKSVVDERNGIFVVNLEIAPN